MESLTERQKDVLDVIKKYIATNGYPPTVREIGDILGLTSPATTQAHFDNLVKKLRSVHRFVFRDCTHGVRQRFKFFFHSVFL